MLKMTDVLEELYKEFPEIDEKAIDKICKTGIAGINKLMRSGEELIIKADNQDPIIFFIPASPKTRAEITRKNVMRRRYKKLKKQNG